MQTNELQSLSENAMHSFTPLPPLNISGYTAVFPPMFQLYEYKTLYTITNQILININIVSILNNSITNSNIINTDTVTNFIANINRNLYQ